MPSRQDIPTGVFFLVCTPLLPFDELERWTADPDLDGSRLARRLHHPDLREALHLASAASNPLPHLMRWLTTTTPSGLSAGFSVGGAGPATRLELEGAASRRHRTRVDIDDLYVLALALTREPRLRDHLRYRPNTSLYRAGDRWRYYACRLEGGARLYDLVAVETDEVLEALLDRAAREEGATLGELVATVRGEETVEAGKDGDADDENANEVTAEDVRAFLDELIDAQLLIPDLLPPVTGAEPLDALIADLEALPPAASAASVTKRLKKIRAHLAELDAAGTETSLETRRATHHRLAGELRDLAGGERGSGAAISGRLQVDLVRPARATLGPEVLAEIQRAVSLLDRLPRQPIKPLLAHFARSFRERWGEGRELPLTEVLDEDTGIGFGLDRETLKALADGAHLRQPPPRWLLEKVETALEQGRSEVAIPEEELETAPRHEVEGGDLPLADAFHVRARLAAASSEAVSEGRFRVHLLGLAGPSGARLLGRLCHADEGLRRRVEGHLAAEEALDPDAVFAEIVHLPEGRPGNGITRPRLRPWEIPFLGRGGADADHRIPIGDLRVAVRDGRIVLRSARLGRRVIPRQTAGHFIGGSHQPLYRFLGALQDEGVRGGWSWHWGSLEGEPFLPRVRSGRWVLTLARWRVPVSELDELAALRGDRRDRAVRRWRREHRLPQRVVLDDPEGEWIVDLDHPRIVDAFLARAEELFAGGETPRARQVILTELFPAPDELCVRGPEGRYLHELVLPMVGFSRGSRASSTADAGTGGRDGAVRRPGRRDPR